MAETSVQKDLKLTRAEQEKQRQAEAARRLYYAWPLPDNINSLKSFAFGAFTWRDVGFVAGSFMIPFVILFPFQLAMPSWLMILLVVVFGAFGSFLSLRHIFTGDLPFEQRVQIAIKDRGQENLLYWDKTKKDGEYVDLSTQSFVPLVEFGDENYVMLPNSKGGFAVLEVAVDDMSQSKNTEVEMTVNRFFDLLNALIKDTDCTPIQIMLKSQPKNLGNYIDKAKERTVQIMMRGKQIASARADDYAALLIELDKEKAYYYTYYIVVTYREDAEHVAENTMNTASVTRKKLQEKSVNPLNKRAKAIRDADLDVGLSEEERKKALRELQRDAEFGKHRTKAAIERRIGVLYSMIADLGTTRTAVKPRILTKHEIAKLIFDCYNTEDKNLIDEILSQALEEKTTMFSGMLYRDYNDLFLFKEAKKKKEITAQKFGMLGRRV